MATIKDFELIDHGIVHSQYFQGCGVTCTDFENVATGIGDNPAEAIDDCLEQMAACGDWDTNDLEKRIMAQEGWDRFPTEPSVPYDDGTGEGDYTDNETYYHVSIRWN